MKKNIITIFSILFIIFFILWASGCHLWEASALLDEPKGLQGCFRGTIIQSSWEMRTNTEQMRQYMEERTGQSLEGWSLIEMQLLEVELDRLERERRESAQAQSTQDPQDETGLESTQSHSAQELFISNEDSHKKDPADSNAPSSSYDSYDDYDNSYEDESTYVDVEAQRDLNGRWHNPYNGDIVYISGDTGYIEEFNIAGQKFADIGMISKGDVLFHNIRPIGNFSELDDMRWLGGYLLEIKNAVEDTDFSDIAALWRCAKTVFVLDGYTEEPVYIEIESGDRDDVIILLPDGDTFYLSVNGARTIQELKNHHTYYRVK